MEYTIEQLENNEYFIDFMPNNIKEKDLLQRFTTSIYKDEDYLTYHIDLAIENKFGNRFILDQLIGQDLEAQFFGVIVTLKVFPNKAS